VQLKEFTDIDGKKRVFEIRRVLAATGVEYEAMEIQHGEPKGMRFAVLGNEDEEQDLQRELIGRIERSLSAKHLRYDEMSLSWITCDDIVRGQIGWDPESEDQMPLVVVDGRELSWEEFGRVMKSYEGFQFVLKFVDPTDDVFE
jgi:hypothetical protein